MTRHHYHIAAVAFILLLTGCAHRIPSTEPQGSEQKPAGAHLSKSQAIQIAKRAAERFGADLSQYAAPTATYQPSSANLFSMFVVEGPGEPPPGDHVWVVNFGWARKADYPGGYLMLFVDDKTGRAQFATSM